MFDGEIDFNIEEQANPVQYLYYKIVGAGLQFQVLSAPKLLRQELFELAHHVKLLVVSTKHKHTENHLTAEQLIDLQEFNDKFAHISKQLPGYSIDGLQALLSTSHEDLLSHIRIVKTSKTASLAPSYTDLLEKQKIAMNELRKFMAQRKWDDPRWVEEGKQKTATLLKVQEAVTALEEEQLAELFFGLDLP